MVEDWFQDEDLVCTVLIMKFINFSNTTSDFDCLLDLLFEGKVRSRMRRRGSLRWRAKMLTVWRSRLWLNG